MQEPYKGQTTGYSSHFMYAICADYSTWNPTLGPFRLEKNVLEESLSCIWPQHASEHLFPTIMSGCMKGMGYGESRPTCAKGNVEFDT